MKQITLIDRLNQKPLQPSKSINSSSRSVDIQTENDMQMKHIREVL